MNSVIGEFSSSAYHKANSSMIHRPISFSLRKARVAFISFFLTVGLFCVCTRAFKQMTPLQAEPVSMHEMLGAYDEPRELTDSEYLMVLLLKAEVEDYTNDIYYEFTPVLIRTQVVSGTNYLVKIKVGDDEYIHVTIY